MTALDDVLKEEPLPKLGDIPADMKVVYGWMLPDKFADQLRPFAAGLAAKHGSEAAHDVVAAIVFALSAYDKRLLGQ